MNRIAADIALLQYEIDKSMSELIELFGEKKAVRAYQMSVEALLGLEEIAETLDIENDFERRSSARNAKVKSDSELRVVPERYRGVDAD